MAYELDKKMVIGVSSRTLFDLTMENEIYETQGLEAYCKYQTEHEKDVLKPGPGFQLVKGLLQLNERKPEAGLVEVIIMSHNSPETALRILHSVASYGLAISRFVLVSGASLAPYLAAFHTDLFLSACEEDVQCAIDNGIAAGIICTEYNTAQVRRIPAATAQIRIAFDGDAVLFAEESERIYREKGLTAFEENERKYAMEPLAEGPFAKFLRRLSDLQREFAYDDCPIRTALVTARSAPAHERVLRTIRAWDVRVDEVFFLGGLEKKEILKAFGAQIFFDDQPVHAVSAAEFVPAARVPYRREAEKRNAI